MEPPHEEQYSQEMNPREYMTMRDYRNLAWQNQQPWERNPNPPRSMRDYRDHWMSAPSYMVPPQYISTPQPPQPPQLVSPVEQAILDLTKLVGDVVEEQKKINAQLSQKIDTMENNVNKRIDGLQSEMEQKLDNLQYSISKLAQHLDHPEEESQEEECLSDTMVEEQCRQHLLLEPSDIGATVCPWENHTALLTEEGSGKEKWEEPQKLILHLNPINLDPSATARPQNNPLPVAPSDNQVYILPSPAPKSTHAAHAPNHKSNPLHVMQNFKELVAIAQIFATTSKKMAAAHIAWHSGLFGCRFGFGAPGPRHFYVPPPTFCFFLSCLVLFYRILF